MFSGYDQTLLEFLLKCLQATFQLFQFLLPVIAITVLAYMSRNHSYWKKKNIQYLKPKPIFGNAFKVFTWQTYVGYFFLDVYKKCTGRLIGFYILDQPYLLIKDLDLIKQILIKDFEYFPNRSPITNHENDPIGAKTIFVSQVPTWYNDRKNLSPLFTSGKLKSKTVQLTVIGNKMVEAVKKQIQTEGSKINVKDICNKYTVHSITSAFFGVEDDSFESKDSPFVALTETMWNWNAKWLALQTIYLFIAPHFFDLFRMNFMDGYITSFFRDVSWKLITEREKSNKKSNDLIDLLLNLKNKENIVDRNSFEADRLAAHICSIFAAGYETSSTTLTFALFELAKNPECQKLAREEIREVLREQGSFTYENIQNMKYLKNCLLETIRLYPIDTFVDRRCVKDYKVPEMDLLIEKGTPLFICVWGIQKDERYFPNPEQFDPDRFTDENMRKRPDMSFLAFGGGPRYCPGKRYALFSSTVCLAHILANFEVQLPEGAPTVVKMNEFGMSSQPKEEIHLNFIEL